MNIISGFGRTVSVAIVMGGLAFGTIAHAQEVSDDQVKAARAAINALGLTNQFDDILPALAERLKGQLIQAYPNYLDQISDAVEQQAIALAPRRADLEREAALVYAKAYTVEELNGIAAFFGSDVGKKMLKDDPIARRELGKAADIWASGIARDLSTETNKYLVETLGKDIQTENSAAPAANP